MNRTSTVQRVSAPWRTAALCGLVLASIPLASAHNVGGPDPGHTGAPGETTCTASGCHTSSSSAPKGTVQLKLSGDGTTYTPGVKQTITISFANGTGKLYGFQMSARVASNNAQAGDFVTPAPSGEQVLCGAAGTVKPSGKTCPTATAIQYAEHSRANTSGNFTFDWTPPATDQGTIKIYLAGNSANGDGTEKNDTISTEVVTLQSAAAAPPPKPVISDSGITTSLNGRVGVVSGGWIDIAGTNFMTGSPIAWQSSDPTVAPPQMLGSVSVTINGNAAFLRYVSPTLIRALVPSDPATGNVPVVITSSVGTSDPFTVNKSAVLPSIVAPFVYGKSTYVLGQLSDGSYAGPAGLLPGLNTRPAVPGETVTFNGYGFGPVANSTDNSDVPAGTAASVANSVVNPVSVQIGGVAVPAGNISYQGLAQGMVGVYQIVLTLPSNLPAGDLPITFSANGTDTAQTMLITIGASQ